jgi:hypothetical protein
MSASDFWTTLTATLVDAVKSLAKD